MFSPTRLLPVALLLVLLAPISVAAQGRPLPVAPPEPRHDQGGPFASDQFLIWTDRTRSPEGYSDDSNNRVLGLDLRSNTPLAVTAAPGPQQAALGISGAVALWTQSDSYAGQRDILAKNLVSGQVYNIAVGPDDATYGAIDGSSVAWENYGSGGAQLLLGDLDGRAPQVIATQPSGLYFTPPVISAEYVVWGEEWQGSFREEQTQQSKLLAYDRRSGATRTLREYSHPYMGRVEYSLWHNRLLWVDPDVNYLDLDSGESATLSQDGFITMPCIFGDTLLWSAGSPNDLDIYAARLSDKLPHLLVGGPGSQLWATLTGGTLVWEDRPDYPPSTIRSAPLDILFGLTAARDSALQPQAQQASTADATFFPETQHTLRGRFRDYWQQHGGLAQQGYPLTEEFGEISLTDGNIYTVQYFQRAVFEYHPQNQPPYDVLLSLLGSAAYAQRYPSGAYPDGAFGQQASTVNPRFFPETGKILGGVFRDYWESHGGLAQQGYPISDEFVEQSLTDGRVYTVQYFQRAVFEYHPENKGTDAVVLLSLLGANSLDRRYLHPGQDQPYPPVPTPDPGSVDNTNLNMVRMVAPDDVWAVGEGGTILHFDGQRWTRQNSNSSADLEDIAMVAPGEGWAVGNDTILHYKDGVWQPVALPGHGDVTSLAMLTPDFGWATCRGCDSDIVVYSGGQWQKVPIFGVHDTQLSIAPDGNGWAVGGYSLRYSDGTWRDAYADLTSKATLPSSTFVQSLPGDEAWAICGEVNSVCHYSGGEWHVENSRYGSSIGSLHMLASGEGWAVGSAGKIIHRSAGAWTLSASPTVNTLNSVDLLAADYGWAVGRGGVILRLQGGEWRRFEQ